MLVLDVLLQTGVQEVLSDDLEINQENLVA